MSNRGLIQMLNASPPSLRTEFAIAGRVMTPVNE